MTTRTILTAGDRKALISLLESYSFPYTVTLRRGKARSIDQNRLQRLWMTEIAEQLQDDTAEGYRAYCKLHFGVPILRAENEEFCAAYDRHIRPLPYETKLACMAVPLDFPCTRLMTSKQMTAYLDAIYREFSGRGVRLTVPDGGLNVAA